MIAMYPPCTYTNDDYRMMTIVSGAYTGTPCADMVFMRYPVGLLLSGLYCITTQISWYGVFTMLCMFVPSCIFCYYIVKKAYLKGYTLCGIMLYTLLFLFVIRKYICLPQFTLTSAFMAVGAAVLLYEMPAERNKKHILLAVICAGVSFSVRSKVFYMLSPILLLIMIIRGLNKNGHKLRKSFFISSAAILAVCGCIYAVDYAASNRNEEYQYYEEFNEARSRIYDYGAVPFYYDNLSFYVKNNISEVTYRALAARFLDLDENVDQETLELIADYMEKVREDSKTFNQKAEVALEDNIEYWLDSGDELVKYSTLFVFLLLIVVLTLCVKNKRINIIFPAATAGLLFESLYFQFSGRLVVRVVDSLLLALAVIGCLTIFDVVGKRKCSLGKYISDFGNNKKRGASVVVIAGSVLFIVFSIVMSLNVALQDKYYSVTVTQNSRAFGLRNYARLNQDCFYFYDAADFISCTEYLFKTYQEDEILNYDSMGSWCIGSPAYYERNEKFGFTTAVEGLTSEDKEVYFVTISEPRLGVTKLLQERYGKTLVLADTVSSDNYSLYIYMVVDDD